VRALGTSRPVRAPSRPLVELALGVVLIFALTFPRLDEPNPGLDASWHAGLFVTVHEGLHFGTQIVFTYGPLGFLNFPALYYPWLSVGAWLYVAVIRLLAIAVMVWAANRILRNRLAAVVVAAVGISAVTAPLIWELGFAAPVTVLVFICCGQALQVPSDRRSAVLLASVGGALAAIELLSKLTIGADGSTRAWGSRPSRRWRSSSLALRSPPPAASGSLLRD
jgi:hypothetical protein